LGAGPRVPRLRVGKSRTASAIEAYRKHSSGRRWHRVGGRAAGGLFLGMRLVVLPHCVTRQESFVLLCQLAQGGEQLPRLELEARQLPQTRKDKFGWQFHGLVYGRFLMPRCDVKHTTTKPVFGSRLSDCPNFSGATKYLAARHREPQHDRQAGHRAQPRAGLSRRYDCL
jgi:hypothetical protein